MENSNKNNEYTVKNKFDDQISDAKSGYQVTVIKKEIIENSENNKQEE